MDLDQTVIATFVLGLQVDPVSGVNGYAGAPLADFIATITDPDPQDPASYSVGIDWGDGESSPPSLVDVVPQAPDTGPPCPNLPESSPECFDVYATHVFANPGPYTATVNVMVGDKSASTFVYVGISQGLFVKANQLYAFAGGLTKQLLATFTDVSPIIIYSYSVRWGDGHTSSVGLISRPAIHNDCFGGVPKNDCFDLFVRHTYSTTGDFNVTVCVSKAFVGIRTKQCDSNIIHVLSLPHVAHDYQLNANDAATLYNLGQDAARDSKFHKAANAVGLSEIAATKASADAELLYLAGKLPDERTVRFWSSWAYADFQVTALYTSAAQNQDISDEIRNDIGSDLSIDALCHVVKKVVKYCYALDAIHAVVGSLDVPPPVVKSFFPNFGSRGTSVIITVDLSNGVPFKVTFGGVIAPFEETSDGAIRATVPAYARTGPICITIQPHNAPATGCTSQSFDVT
jgi:hypothetical protein